MTHETAILLGKAVQILEDDMVTAVVINDKHAILATATAAAYLRHVIKYVIEGEENYGRS